MVAQQQTAEFSGEVVRNGVATVTWFARPLEQSEAFNRERLTDLHLDHNKDELQRTVQGLTDNLRKRHEAITTVCSSFQARLQKALENFSPGQEMDPNDIAVPELEKSEEYFRKEREELRNVRDTLQQTGGTEAHGTEVFAELERLDKLFEYLIASFQELRWAIMINDGSLAQSTEKTDESGAKFKASLEKLEVLRQGMTSGSKSSEPVPFKIVPNRSKLVPGIDPQKLNQLNDQLEAEDFAGESAQ